MRGALAALLVLASPLARAEDARVDEKGLAFVYVSPNVGMASGGHAALRADGAVYHLQNSDAGLLLLVRDGWPSFRLVYAELQNRPLELAHLDAAPEVTEQVQRAFARLYVEQEMELARRAALRDDVAWLEAFASGAAAPPLRGAGLVAPERAGDLDAARLRAAVESRLGDGVLVRSAAEADARIAASQAGADLAALREAVALREALRALADGYGLADAAVAALPAEVDVPLTAGERRSLEELAGRLERTVAELLGSARPDRGYALFLAQARYLAARRSLATGRLVILDAFTGSERADPPPDDVADSVRALRRAEALATFQRGRGLVLAPGRLEEENLNLLEEAAAITAREGRADGAGPLSDFGLRKLPARGRSLPVAHDGDVSAALARARERLAAQEARLAARWSYELTRRNCITELARTTGGAFGSEAEMETALGGEVPPPGEPFGFVPYVFFARARDRLRIERVDSVPGRRAGELARVLHESPGFWTAARESAVPTSTIYGARLRDGAFLLFTDDVFWPRPLYGALNLAYGVGYSLYGVAAAPFDGGARLHAGASGVMWSVPELAFVNVRKGSFDWKDEPR